MEAMVIEEQLSKFKGKKVLITGHTGFKGSWLSLWLHQLGAEIVGVALSPKTKLDNYIVSNVSTLLKDYRTDIRDFKELQNIFEIEQPEILFHLAAQPLVLESYHSPLETFEINTQGTANILEIVRTSKSIKTAVFITTDKVYENKEWIWPYREDERLGGYDPYSASKGAAELIIASYRNSFLNPKNYINHGKSIASVRAGNVIGGGDWADFRIIPDCVRAIENNEAIELRSPKSVRPWQHVLEPLGGYLLLASKMMDDPITYAQAYNFGPGSENIVEVGVLVDKFIKEFERGSWNDISDSAKMHEANLLALDINKSKIHLNWKPVLNFEQTITFTAEWYKNYKVLVPQQICLKQIDNYVQLWKLKNVN